MKQISFWVLLSLCCLASTIPQVYYITPGQPDHGNCTVDNMTLTPCYNTSQLTSEVLSSNHSSVRLLFLSGTHLIQENQTVMVSNFSEVVIRPWNKEQVVVIECQLKADFDFQDITELKILHLHFSFCELQYNYGMNIELERFVNITACVFERSREFYAIAIKRADSRLNITVSKCTFSSNNGAMFVLNQEKYTKLAHLQITDTLFQGHQLGVMVVQNIAMLTVKNSRFISNTPNLACIFTLDSFLLLDNTTFYNNDVTSILSSCSSVNVSNCHFRSNSGGAVIHIFPVIFVEECARPRSFFVNSVFQGNRGNPSVQGSAIYIEANDKVTISNCQFENNSAYNGGALTVKNGNSACHIYNTSFIFNEAENDGGAIYCKDYETINIEGGYSISNTASGRGGFVHLSNCRVVIRHYTYNISNNLASNGGAFYSSDLLIALWHHTSILANNLARQDGGAMYLINSEIQMADSLAVFNHNEAGKGGAIFVLDKNCEEVVNPYSCIFIYGFSEEEHLLIFLNNSANQGPILYGGLLDRCLYSGKLGVDFFETISLHEPAPLAITSDPVRVCLCSEDFKPNCTTRELVFSQVQRGQTIDLIGTAVDQDNNPKASLIRASYGKISDQLGKGEGIKETGSECRNLSYHVFTTNSSAVLTLQPDGYCERSDFSIITVHIDVVPCSKGFELNGDKCECDKRLTDFFSITACDIDTHSIVQREGSNIWLIYGEELLEVHLYCPLDHCRSTFDPISVEFPDEQCANNRSGVVCGACRENYSIALGGSKCLQCTSNYTLIWLIPVFAVAGIALVALLVAFNMTISHGTLNGLIFYANVVSITSLQNCSIHPILSVFIAWVNLDLGVETCFYSGMDTYQKTWLQFVFPLYIWLLVGAIILASHYSATATKVFGRNNIAVLATLFLLSYTKILKTIITALYFTQVLRGTANDTSDPLVPYTVWTYDGNIEYLKGKHVPLFAVALMMLVFLFLPYTLLLIFGQFIRSMRTHRRCLIWCIRSTAFVSIMDAYHAPYNRQHRYWTGLMLLARCVLFLAFFFDYNSNQLIANIYITTLIVLGIFTLKALTTKVYRNICINILELCFLLNLAILSVTVHFLRSSSSNSCLWCVSISISVSIVFFAGILTYHAYLKLCKTKCFTNIKVTFLAKMWPSKQNFEESTTTNTSKSTSVICDQTMPTTTTIIGLREELIVETQH